MREKTIQEVCPELKNNKGLAIYLDVDMDYIWLNPDKKHEFYLKQIVELSNFFNCIVIGGSTGVTRENASELSTKLQQHGYAKKRIGLLPPKHDVLCDNYGFVILPSLLNSKNPYFRYEFAEIVRPQVEKLEASGVTPIYIAYLLVEPADKLTVGKVTNPDIIGKNDYEKAKLYCNQAIDLDFHTISLEAGSGAYQHVPEDIVNIIRQRFNGIITVGGGVNTSGQIYSILNAGANLVSLGNILETSCSLEQLLSELHSGVRKANNQ